MELTVHDRCAIAHSVYNALSLTGRDMTILQVVAFLHSAWDVAVSRAAAHVDVETVETAAAYLERRQLITRDGDRLVVPDRHPQTRCGPAVDKTPDRKDLQCH